MNIKKMMMSLATLAVLSLSVTGARAQAITNGSFETTTGPSLGNFNGSGPPVFGGATGFSTNGTDVTFTSAEGASQGVTSAIFNGGQGNTIVGNTLSQTFGTVVGQTYVVSFDFGAYGGAGTERLTASVLNGAIPIATTGATLATATNTGTSLVTMPAFKTTTFSFIASGASTTLQFNDAGSDTNNIDGVLDNVIATAGVPEPGTLAAFAFMGMGLMAMMLRARKGRRVSALAV